MKFSNYLESHALPAWRSKYINYKLLKKMIHDIDPPQPTATPQRRYSNTRKDVTTDESSSLLESARRKSVDGETHMQLGQAAFQRQLGVELEKISAHYAVQIQKAKTMHEEIWAQLEELGVNRPLGPPFNRNFSGSVSSINSPPSSPPDSPSPMDDPENHYGHRLGGLLVDDQRYKYAIRLAKDALSQLYNHLKNVKSFQLLNTTAVFKIIKKYEKHRGSKPESAMFSLITGDAFANTSQVDSWLGDIETLYTEIFCQGHRRSAMSALDPVQPSAHKRQKTWSTFRLGLYVGMTVMGVLTVLLKVILGKPNMPTSPFDHQMWVAFRGLTYPVLMLWLFAINMYAWRMRKINHQYVFELHPIKHLTFLDVCALAASLSALMGFALVLYESSHVPREAAHYVPLGVYICALLFLINPLHCFHRSARYWLFGVVSRVLAAPFHEVGFADFWLADQFNSLVCMFLDWQATGCHYLTNWDGTQENPYCTSMTNGVRPVIMMLPAWFRFAQCLRRFRDTGLAFPHLVNAGKYITTIFAVFFAAIRAYTADSAQPLWNVWHVFWVATMVVQTLYASAYDFKMDWGLLRDKDGLRQSLFYPKYTYYCAMVFNLAARCLWVIKIDQTGFETVSHMTAGWMDFFLAICEIMRRFVWNFFRVENEYVNDCLQFQAILATEIPTGVPQPKPINQETYADSRALHASESKVIGRVLGHTSTI